MRLFLYPADIGEKRGGGDKPRLAPVFVDKGARAVAVVLHHAENGYLKAVLFDLRQRGEHLHRPAVDKYKVGQGQKTFVPLFRARKAARQRFRHCGGVVARYGEFYLILFIIAFDGRKALENDLRRDGV